jgi:hypothetical protein
VRARAAGRLRSADPQHHQQVDPSLVVQDEVDDVTLAVRAEGERTARTADDIDLDLP